MITWEREAVERFLERIPVRREFTSPLGTHVEYIFDLPSPTGLIRFSVRPSLDHCQFYTDDDHAEFISAHVQCTRIVINDDPEEEGGQCLVLQGKAGHACVTPSKPYFRLFFSMHGKPTDRTSDSG
jgi:hypothetical protein